MKEKNIIISGQKVFYRENIVDKENEEILFFMHGWGASSDLFLQIFPKDKNWIAIDFPNFGKSSKVNAIWDMNDYAKNTYDFINKVTKDKKITFIVHSFGGRVLLKMISNFNLPADKIIYMGVPFYRNSVKKINKKSLIIKYFHKIFNLPILSLIKKPLEKILYKMIYSEDYLALQNDKNMQGTFKNVVSDDLAQYISLVKDKENILIWGENDDIVPLEKAEKFIAETNNSKLYKIKNSEHFPFLENKKEFLEIFNKIIK